MKREKTKATTTENNKKRNVLAVDNIELDMFVCFYFHCKQFFFLTSFPHFSFMDLAKIDQHKRINISFTKCMFALNIRKREHSATRYKLLLSLAIIRITK